jgi:hypothetical protein
MASTGEVACFGDNLEEAFYTSWLATEQQVNGKNIFISLPDEQKPKFIEEMQALQENDWKIYTTIGTHDYYKKHGVDSIKLGKVNDKNGPSVATAIEQRMFDLMINVPSLTRDDSGAYKIRRLAIDNHLPLITNAEIGRLLARCLTDPSLQDLKPKYWDEYVRLG